MKKLVALFLVTGFLAAAEKGRGELRQVQGVRHWTSAGVTRVAIEVSGDFTYRSERLHNPERLFFDILRSRPSLADRSVLNQDIDNPVLKRLRVAETSPGVTRVVLDLYKLATASISKLSNPDRLVIEFRNGHSEPQPSMPAPPTLTSRSLPRPPDALATRTPNATPPAAPPKKETPKVEAPRAEAPKTVATSPKPEVAPRVEPPAKSETASVRPESTKPEREKPAEPVRAGQAARPTATGGSSLTRALGLKITRVVIDPGHGGHDQGTSGPKGLTEKELVLDVALRLGRMIEQKLGAEVFYTRSTDVFVPLETRTAIANENKADLFLSIHANSSSFPRIGGAETYYLNFTDSKDALEVASRENASSQKSVYQLRDLIQKISLHEKIEESKELAGRLQASLYSFSARNFPGTKNRGVKKAPFIVLIGANMPSVLAEIGFLSNPREELLLKRADHREKLAEALFRGVSRYSEGLSHFQVAASAEREAKSGGQGK